MTHKQIEQLAYLLWLQDKVTGEGRSDEAIWLDAEARLNEWERMRIESEAWTAAPVMVYTVADNQLPIEDRIPRKDQNMVPRVFNEINA